MGGFVLGGIMVVMSNCGMFLSLVAEESMHMGCSYRKAAAIAIG